MQTLGLRVSAPLLHLVLAIVAAGAVLLSVLCGEASLKTLNGLLPICAWCKSLRNDAGYRQSVEGYVEQHSDAPFSHGFCPDCALKHSPGWAKSIAKG